MKPRTQSMHLLNACWSLSKVFIRTFSLLFHFPVFFVMNKKSFSLFTGSSVMNKLRQSFRRKKDIYVPESSRPHQWQTDEEAVRSGKCSFAVKVTLLTNKPTCRHTHTHRLYLVQLWPHWGSLILQRSSHSSPRTLLVINHSHWEIVSAAFN